jgi:hypothetical protein
MLCRDPSAEPLRLLMLVFSGWVSRRQLDMIEYHPAVPSAAIA